MGGTRARHLALDETHRRTHHWRSPRAPIAQGIRTILAALAFAGVCQAATRSSVILISVDTLRADRLGCYGAQRASTPHIDAIATGGTRFANISSQVPLTLPSHVSLLTSTYPFSNGVRDNGQPLPGGTVTLATTLRRHGFHTAAFVASFVLDRRFGLNQGFDVYNGVTVPIQSNVTDPGNLKLTGEDVTKAASDWLRQNLNQPFFLFIHLYDLHTPYSLPGRGGPLSYNDMLDYEDTVIGRFWDELRSQKILDHALVVFVSDHGEALGDHGESTHGFFIYQSTLHVPLIIHWPVSTSFPAITTAPAGLIDVAPTITDYLGMQEPASFQGRSLLEVLRHPSAEHLGGVYSESLYAAKHFGCSSLRSIQDGGYKYIDSAKPELYQLTTDPGEKRNLYFIRSVIASNYRERLRLFTLRFASATSSTPKQLTSDAVANLRSLGYLAGTATRSDDTLSRPAPIDRIADYDEYDHAVSLGEHGHPAQALSIMRKLVERDADLLDTRLSMGLIEQRQRAYTAAAEDFREVLKQDPTNAVAHCDLAMSLLRLGKRAEAERELEVALTFAPYYTHAEELLSSQLLADKRFDAAHRHLEHILQNDPTNFEANYTLGALAANNRRFRDASAYLTIAVRSNAGSADAQNVLGSVEFMQGKLVPAERDFRQAIRLSPCFSMAHYNLGLVLEKNGNHTAALREFRQAVECDPHNGAARQALQSH